MSVEDFFNKFEDRFESKTSLQSPFAGFKISSFSPTDVVIQFTTQQFIFSVRTVA